MEKQATMASLFEKSPWQWGTRGDPHLWSEMKGGFEHVPRPATAQEATELIEAAFARLVGHPISHPESVFVQRYDHGGMSGGFVNTKWWRERGLPFLLEAYASPKDDGSTAQEGRG